jgi:hypothetical protein
MHENCSKVFQEVKGAKAVGYRITLHLGGGGKIKLLCVIKSGDALKLL